HHRVRRVDPSTGIITTLVGTTEGQEGDGGPPDQAQLKTPVRTLTTTGGDILIAEHGSNRVRRLRKDTGLMDTFAGSLTAGFGGDGGLATAAMLNQPNDIDQDAAGNVYIADFMNHRIRKVDTSGIITTFAGTGVPGFAGDAGPATAAQLNFPACVLAAPGDVLYVC